MIEVLISLLILTIGVLGLAGLQFAAIKFNRSSYERTQATNLVYDLADRMRANRREAALGSYGFARAAPPTAAPTVNCGSAACTSAQMAEFDRYNWYQQIKTVLAGGSAEVTCMDTPCTNISPHRVTVYWPDRASAGVSLASCSTGVVAENSCISILFQP